MSKWGTPWTPEQLAQFRQKQHARDIGGRRPRADGVGNAEPVELREIEGRPIAVDATEPKPRRWRAPNPNQKPLFVQLCALLREYGIAEPRCEYAFHHGRRWRFDFAWPTSRVALEIEGGIWSKDFGAKAAHSMPLAILRDMEKHNAGVLLGWRILRFTPQQIAEAAAAVDILMRNI